jgi:hypothetical protein
MYMNHLLLFIMLEFMHSLHGMILVCRENISLDCDWFNVCLSVTFQALNVLTVLYNVIVFIFL